MVFKKIKILLEFIKIRHTLFALPFLYSGAILASKGIPSLHVLMWITIGIFSARSAAMSLNRLIDKDLDAKNPRTKDRALPKGLLRTGEVIAMIILCLAILFLSALKLNYTSVKLYPFAVAIFVIYPFLKRYTWLSHIVLGMGLGMAPLGAWAAVTDSIELPALLLGAAVTFWAAGFDVIYSLQDLEFDKKFKLYSIPAIWGVKKGLLSSSMFHGLTVTFLLAIFLWLGLGLIFLFGIVAISLLLAYEHKLIKPDNFEKVQVAFFNINVMVSIAFFSSILLDVLFPISII